MPEFNVRSDSIDVQQIMEQIRARIREKRGVDYTEQQLRELAAVKLEKFLDPRGVRSDLLERFRRVRAEHEPPSPPNYTFEQETLYETHRAAIRWIRRLLQPILKLLFNPNPLIQALHIQSRLNTLYAERESARRGLDELHYEVLHNLVLETTRLGIEVKNLKMRVESLASRLDFSERRARALESVVAYRSGDQTVEPKPAHDTETPRPVEAISPARDAGDRGPGMQSMPPGAALGEGPGQRSRRRRRRRGRRGGAPAPGFMEGRTGGQQLPARPEDDATSELSRPHAETGETVERALAVGSHPTEPVAEGEATPPPGPHGPDPDQQ